MSSYGLWLSASGMKVSDLRQTLISNNLANVSTAGFKQDLAIVRQRRVESQSAPMNLPFAHPVLDGLTGGVNVRPTFQDHEQGPIKTTNRPLDVAISGEGFFAVSDGSTTRYTRNGQFAVDASGNLTLSAGNGRWKLLDDAGAVISLEEGAGKAYIAGDGTVRQGNDIVAKLGVMTTDDKQTLRKVGQNLFEANAKMVPINARFEANSIEGSNADPMKGLAAMIEATRAFQLNATMIRIQDDMTGQTISRVGRLQ